MSLIYFSNETGNKKYERMSEIGFELFPEFFTGHLRNLTVLTRICDSVNVVNA